MSKAALPSLAMAAAEDEQIYGIASGDESGGTHTSRTIMLSDLRALLAALSAESAQVDYRSAVVDDNVLGKGSASSRQRSFRYLKALYLLDPSEALFRALRDLWDIDPGGRPIIAMLCALARDPSLRATSPAVLRIPEGAPVSSQDLQSEVQEHFDSSYSDSIANKIGRNAASSWTQSGHLEGRANKKRTHALATPGSAAYALFVGYLTGQRGAGLFETVYAQTLDEPPSRVHSLASAAAQRHWLDYRRAGDVVDIGFNWLLREDTGASE